MNEPTDARRNHMGYGVRILKIRHDLYFCKLNMRKNPKLNGNHH